MLPEEFIALVAPAARQAVRAHGVWASVCIAQAALETGWGTSPLVAHNALWGVKWHGPAGGPFPAGVAGAVPKRTTERPDSGSYVTTALFRTYASITDGALDYGANLRAKDVYGRTGCWDATTPDEFVRLIGPVYTGGDSTYAAKVISIMDRYQLRDYDQEATMRIIPRSEWGARPATNRTTVPPSQRRTFVLHYDDARPTTRTGKAVPQAIQRFHMNSNGWADIGYNFIIDQSGAIFEGRGWDVLGAHAGAAGNREGIGVQVHIGGTQQPSAAALASAEWLWKQANARFGRTLTLRGHQNYMATSCPGAPLMTIVRNGFPPSATPAPKPPPVAVSPPPQTATEEDPVPDHRELHASIDAYDPHQGWAIVPGSEIIQPRERPQRASVTAHVTLAHGGEGEARFVSWDNKGKRWVRYPALAFRGSGVLTLQLGQAGPDAGLQLDVRADTPGAIDAMLTALTWEV